MKLDKRWAPAILTPVLIGGMVALPSLSATAVDLPDLSPQEIILLMDSPVVEFEGVVYKVSNLGLPSFELSSMMTQDMIDSMSEAMPEGMEDLVPQVLEQNPLMDVLGLLSGTHKARVYSSENAARIQILDPMSQRDLIINEDEVWFYDYRDAVAYKLSKPKIDETKKVEFESYLESSELNDVKKEAETYIAEYAAELGVDLTSPESIANYIISRFEAYSTITVGQDHNVAGRTAYKLVLTPISDNTLVDSVHFSVDSETGMVLDLEVYSVEETEPVFKIGFTSIKMGEPSASIFLFTPPTGTTVIDMNELPDSALLELDFESYKKLVEEELMELEAHQEFNEKYNLGLNEPQEQEIIDTLNRLDVELKEMDIELTEILGEGWDSVIRIPANSDADLDMINNRLLEFGVTLEEVVNEVKPMIESFSSVTTLIQGMFKQIGDNKVFSTPLLNVLVSANGDIYIGSVTLDYLTKLAETSK